MRFLIIGGSDAGISTALRAQEIDSRAEITVLLEDEFPNYSICGLPFFLSGENAAGGRAEFAGSLGTQVVKVFSQVIGRTGLNHEEARREGFEPWTVESSIKDHKAYYPGATELHIRVTGDLRSGVLLGAQLQGVWGAELSKRLDIYATAIFHEMHIDQLSHLDLSYTPPLSSPWDPVQTAAQVWCASRKAINDRRC